MLKTRKKIVQSQTNKKSIIKRRWFRDFVLLLMLFSSSAWLIFKTPIFEIKKIKISSPSKIKGGIAEIASREKNFFLFNEVKTSQEIKEKYPQVKSVLIEKKFPSTVLLKVKEGKAVGLFCSKKKELSCFLISEEGFLIKKEKPKRGLLIFISHELKNFQRGNVVMEKRDFREILSFVEELKRAKIYPKKIDIFPFEIVVKTNKNFKIYFLKKNFTAQTRIFFNIFKNTLKPKEKSHLEYIDFRSLEGGEKGAVYWR